MMKKLIIDIKTGKQEYLDMTLEEEVQRLEDIARAKEDNAREEAEEQKRRDAIERLRTSVNKDTMDLLEVLNL